MFFFHFRTKKKWEAGLIYNSQTCFFSEKWLSHAAVPGVGRHDSGGMTATTMVGGCMVYLLLPTHIACHVSAFQKILSMQSSGFCLRRQRRNLVLVSTAAKIRLARSMDLLLALHHCKCEFRVIFYCRVKDQNSTSIILWVTQFVSDCWHRKLVCACKKSQKLWVRSVLLSRDCTVTFSPAHTERLLKFGISPPHYFWVSVDPKQ